MSRLFAIGLAAAAVSFAATQPANAGHRHCRYYGSYYYPTYTNYGAYYAPPTAVVTTPVPPSPAQAAGQVAQSESGVYRSFADVPGQAAPAVTYQAAPVTGGFAPGPTAGDASNYGTVGNPYGGSGVTIGGTPAPASNYGTAGNPYGASSGMTFGGGVSGGGTSGGTAGHPY